MRSHKVTSFHGAVEPSTLLVMFFLLIMRASAGAVPPARTQDVLQVAVDHPRDKCTAVLGLAALLYGDFHLRDPPAHGAQLTLAC